MSVESYERTLEALKIAVSHSAPKKAYEKNAFGRKSEVYLAAAWRYFFVPEETLESIGERFGVTRQRMEQIRDKVYEVIGRYLPEEAKQEIVQVGGVPWEELNLRKPVSIKTRMLNSDVHGGIASTVLEMINNGATKEEIAQTLGINETKLGIIIRKLVKEWKHQEAREFLNPLALSRENNEGIEKLLKESDDDEIQQVLNRIDRNFVNSRIYQKKDPVVMTLGRVIKDKFFGYHSNSQFFLDSLKRFKIPFSSVEQWSTDPKTGEEIKVGTYHVVAGKHRDRILAAFDNDPTLIHFKKNPVRQIAPKERYELPTITRVLHDRENFVLISDIFKRAGLKRHIHSGETIESKIRELGLDTNEQCPPIFQCRQSPNMLVHVVHKEHADRLLELLKNILSK